MSATIHLSHLVLDRHPRTGWPARLRVRVRSSFLDQRRAIGADPWSDTDLSLRAEQLTDPAQRLRIAAAIDRLIAEADGPPPVMSSALRHRLAEIAEALGT